MKEKVEEVVDRAVENLKDVTSEKNASVVPQELDQNQALNVLVSAVRLAQKRGAYELEEVELILKAIKLFTTSK